MWFTEDPWSPIVVFSIIAAVAFVSWMSGRRTRDLVVIGVMVIAGAASVVVDQIVVTDPEQVERHLHSMVTAFEQDDADGIIAYISQQAPELPVVIQAGMQRARAEGRIRVTDKQLDVKSGSSRILTHFRANGTIVLREQNYSTPVRTRWRFTWQKEAGEWKVIKIERLNFLTGEPVSYFDRRA